MTDDVLVLFLKAVITSSVVVLGFFLWHIRGLAKLPRVSTLVRLIVTGMWVEQLMQGFIMWALLDWIQSGRSGAKPRILTFFEVLPGAAPMAFAALIFWSILLPSVLLYMSRMEGQRNGQNPVPT